MCAKPQTIMGTIIVAVIVASLSGTLGWIALRSADVPTIKVELVHLSKAISGMTDSIKDFERSNRESHQEIIDVMNGHSYKIKALNKDCEELRKSRGEK